MRIFRAVCLILGLIPILATTGLADERILSFDSFIEVDRDGSQIVTETIRVQAEQKEIKRGIYRDFPTRYRDRYGHGYVVDFDVLEVLRDGRGEPYHLEAQPNGMRVYIGAKSVFIPRGIYTYTLKYRTNRQIGYFEDSDELYWNVTGNGWEFPIDQASCSVALPGAANGQVLERDGYTGVAGAQDKNFVASVDYKNRTRFITTRRLFPKEGLTIVVRWPKGFVDEPTLNQRLGYFFKDNVGLLLACLGLFVILGYYINVWNAVGRDPEKGVIIPLYEPDKRLTPAGMRYLMRMGYDHKVFTAAIISMAVKGYLTIREEGKVYTLEKTGETKTVLTAEEAAAAKILFGNNKSITLENQNHAIIRAAMFQLQRGLKAALEKTYFVTNRKYFFPGLLITLGFIIITGLMQAEGPKQPILGFITIWLSIWTCGVFALAKGVVAAWRAPGYKASALGMTMFALPFFAGELFGLGILAYATSVGFLIFFVLCLFINILFYHLLKAPTALGRKTMDRIEGFKMYLSVAEGDVLKRMALTEQTPELYEKYLPYALALDVEQQWSQRFSDILARESADGESYRPRWYSGPGFRTFGPVGFGSALSGSLSNAISSSSVAPGSSSGGGGGGFSGGGGGGGGW